MLSLFAEKASRCLARDRNLKSPSAPLPTSSISRFGRPRSKIVQKNASTLPAASIRDPWRTFTSSRSAFAHPRLVLSEEQEMECVAVPTMFHLGRAIKTVNLLRNLDKFGRPLGVAVSEDAPGTPDMLEAVDVLPNRSFSEILEAEAVAAGYTMDKTTTAPVLANYPLPTDEIPAQFKSSTWKQWYNFLEQKVWHKQSQSKKSPTTTAGSSVPPTREAFLSTMRASLTQAVQHFPSVLSGSIPLERTVGGQETKLRSWLRIGQAYFDAGSLNEGAISEIMSMRSDETNYEKIRSADELSSRQYPAEEFKWIHFSPEDPRLLYMAQPPPLSLIYQQIEKHLLLTPNFTLVPHQLEVYGGGVETLPRYDPLDPNFLGTVIIALPTAGCVGGAIRLTNLNHTAHQGAAEVPDEDLSRIDSDLSRVLTDIHLQGPGSESAAHECPPDPIDLDLGRLEGEIGIPDSPHSDHAIGDAGYRAETPSGSQGGPSKGSASCENWSNFSWAPFGERGPSDSQTTVRTGRGHLSVPAAHLSCEPSGLSWVAFTKNVPYCIEKVESGNRVLLTYHIISKNSTNTHMQQPTKAEVDLSASSVSHLESEMNLPLVNALFSPRMRQSGISKLVSLVAYYFNHAQKGNWLSHGEDDLTTLGIALRDTYAPELLEAEQLMGSDMWLYNVFKWACSQQSGIFHNQMRVLLAPVAMIHQGQLGHSSQRFAQPTTKTEKTKASSKGKTSRSAGSTSEAGAEDSDTGSRRWEAHQHIPPNNLVYFLNLEGWEHEGPVLAHDAYLNCARYSSLPARPLSSMERTIYGTDQAPSNSNTEWHSIPILYGQRWGEELDTWEPAPIVTRSSTKRDPMPESFHVVGRKTFATTALIIQKIQQDHENQL